MSETQQQSIFARYNDLALANNGGRVIFATDEWFGSADNLLKESEPEWREGVFTEYGKWMDGWETRRKRIPGHDWTIIQLGVPGDIRGILVDTAFFTGNYAPRFSLQAKALTDADVSDLVRRASNVGVAATQEEFKRIEKLESEKWTELIPITPLQPGNFETKKNYFELDKRGGPWTHIRFNIYPDGGVARLRVYGVAKCEINDPNLVIDLAAMENGGECIRFSNAHFAHPQNLIRPGNARNMGDGWETARRLDRPPVIKVDEEGCLQVPGEEWAEFSLGQRGLIERIEIDTRPFKGNSPDNIRIEGADKDESPLEWQTIIPKTKLAPDCVRIIQNELLLSNGPFKYIRVTIAPDGGLSRLRIYGRVKQKELYI